MRIGAALLLILAAYYRSGPLFFAVGVALLLAVGAQFWLRVIGREFQVGRILEPRLFFGEAATVRLTFANRSTLPIPWLEIHESMPAALALPNVLSRVMHLAPQQHATVTYTLHGRRRGFHAVGPLTATMGDVFGLARRELRFAARQHLLVYPRILPVDELRLPALAMFGVVRSRRQLLGDPSRLAGVRQYVPGDPLHDIHWPATAATGTLQVKHYQPATTHQAVIFLDLQRAGYSAPDVLSAAEFAISVAATIASRLIEQRQEVGLVTNGQVILPPVEEQGATPEWDELRLPAAAPDAHIGPTEPAYSETTRASAPIGPARGRAQLMRVLEVLARVEPHEQGESLIRLLLQRTVALPWGSTVVVIAGATSEELFLALHKLRQVGLLVVLFLVEPHPDVAAVEARARAVGVTLQVAWRDADMQAVRA
ncbi:MAG TPA: DUF58 domain-containing protein [Chloroflexota bacterium]|nr:DUF58 domain-containing protein [Chloroflexota bacterium]